MTRFHVAVERKWYAVDIRGLRAYKNSFVCAIDRSTQHMVRFRSYDAQDEFLAPTIVEAALATSAAPTFFEPVHIGQRTFADGAFGCNNPVDAVEEEAREIWCPEMEDLPPLVKCFVSIGTGHPGTKPFPNGLFEFLRDTLLRLSTETENTERKFMGRWVQQYVNKQYFRFNVDQGLQDIGLQEYQQNGLIQAASENYLTHTTRRVEMRNCIANLRLKKSVYIEDFA